MMKHHQPWLCEQVIALHAPAGAIGGSPCEEFPSGKLKPADPSLGSLSDLLLALQDELGQMSLCVGVGTLALPHSQLLCTLCFVCFFPSPPPGSVFLPSEHQDLLGQLDVVQNREEKEDLKLELESLVTRMEEKGAQISKLRKHWQMVCPDQALKVS